MSQFTSSFITFFISSVSQLCCGYTALLLRFVVIQQWHSRSSPASVVRCRAFCTAAYDSCGQISGPNSPMFNSSVITWLHSAAIPLCRYCVMSHCRYCVVRFFTFYAVHLFICYIVLLFRGVTFMPTACVFDGVGSVSEHLDCCRHELRCGAPRDIESFVTEHDCDPGVTVDELICRLS